MAILNMTTGDAVLKELYNGQRVENLVYKAGGPLLALLPKMEDFVGRNYPLPIKYGHSQNRSATFATAAAETTSALLEQFALTRVSNYGLSFIGREFMKAAESDKGSFLKEAVPKVDGALENVALDIAFSLGRDSSGYRAQVNAEPAEASTTVITLKSAADAVGFEVGQSLVIYSAKSGGSQRIFATSVTTGLVSAVTRNATTATITINVAYDSNGTIAADDYIFVSGDRGSKISGLEDWLPTTAPGATSFFGVDRSADTSRLGGNIVTGTGMPIEEALIAGAIDASREGGSPDMCFVNHKVMRKLLQQLQSRVSFVDVQANAQVGFRGVEVQGGSGTMVVMADRNIRDSRAYCLEMDTWVLASLGPLVNLVDEDGSVLLRSSTADSFEVRAASYAQLGCKAPGRNAVITLD